jgi:hypothetical protein
MADELSITGRGPDYIEFGWRSIRFRIKGTWEGGRFRMKPGKIWSAETRNSLRYTDIPGANLLFHEAYKRTYDLIGPKKKKNEDQLSLFGG